VDWLEAELIGILLTRLNSKCKGVSSGVSMSLTVLSFSLRCHCGVTLE